MFTSLMYPSFVRTWLMNYPTATKQMGRPKYGVVAQSLVSPFILRHRDKDVKAYAACCLADILRIFAPEAPYGEETVKGNLYTVLFSIVGQLC